MGIPIGKKAREAVATVKDVADRTSGFIKIALAVSVLALCIACAALVRGARTAAA